jgi:hypothetical protein
MLGGTLSSGAVQRGTLETTADGIVNLTRKTIHLCSKKRTLARLVLSQALLLVAECFT